MRISIGWFFFLVFSSLTAFASECPVLDGKYFNDRLQSSFVIKSSLVNGFTHYAFSATGDHSEPTEIIVDSILRKSKHDMSAEIYYCQDDALWTAEIFGTAHLTKLYLNPITKDLITESWIGYNLDTLKESVLPGKLEALKEKLFHELPGSFETIISFKDESNQFFAVSFIIHPDPKSPAVTLKKTR